MEPFKFYFIYPRYYLEHRMLTIIVKSFTWILFSFFYCILRTAALLLKYRGFTQDYVLNTLQVTIKKENTFFYWYMCMFFLFTGNYFDESSLNNYSQILLCLMHNLVRFLLKYKIRIVSFFKKIYHCLKNCIVSNISLGGIQTYM